MEHVTRQDTKRYTNSPNCTAFEYATKNAEINMGIVEITGRYPNEGHAINHKCTEIGYILKGSGKFVTEDKIVHFSEGDVILIPQEEKYHWEGTVTIVIASTPAWYPDQHEHINASKKFGSSQKKEAHDALSSQAD